MSNNKGSKSRRTAQELQTYRTHGRLMTLEEQDTYLRWHARGLHRDKILAKMRISNATLIFTKNECAEFMEAHERISKDKLTVIENEAFQGALGAWRTTKTTYQAVFERDGKPVLDEHGNQKMSIVKKEETQHPPSWNAIEFLLKVRMPEIYGTKNLQHDQPAVSLDMIKVLLEGKVKELEASNSPYTLEMHGLSARSEPQPEVKDYGIPPPPFDHTPEVQPPQ